MMMTKTPDNNARWKDKRDNRCGTRIEVFREFGRVSFHRSVLDVRPNCPCHSGQGGLRRRSLEALLKIFLDHDLDPCRMESARGLDMTVTGSVLDSPGGIATGMSFLMRTNSFASRYLSPYELKRGR